MTRISEAVECLESLGYTVTPPADRTMTERQAKAWPEYVAEAREFAPSIRDTGYGWVMDWREETRPGRGNDLSALWSDGEHFVQITLDVYGHGSVSVAETHWLHNSADEECAENNHCARCARLNAEPTESSAEFTSGQCAASHPLIDGGTRCRYLAGHEAAGLPHTTPNGMFWFDNPEPTDSPAVQS